MATKKTRIQKAEQTVKAAGKQTNTTAALLQIRKVDYRTGIDPNIPEPPDAIPLRLIDMTIQKKDGET